MHQDALAERRNNIAPIPFEADAPFLKIVGELPRELNGTLYRNGPNPQFDSPGTHWFVGDGMLHAFHLEEGRSSYRNRWVHTPKWLAEHDAGRALFGGFGRKLPDAPAHLTDGGVANTNIIFHAGKLLALEEAHLPTEIEPGTLATRGYNNYQGRVAGPFTAHPKVDPVRTGTAKDIVWFRAEACYVFHVMNAWEDGDRIIADVMQFEEAPLFPHPDGRPTDPEKSRARHCRWTFDLSGNTDRFQQTYLDDLTGEFPRIDDRRAGLKSRHGWYACANPRLPMFGALSGIVHVDGAGKRLGQYLLPAGDTISEPVFVERSKDAAEGDGWLLAVVWRAQENRSDLAVFNATDIEAGPAALVQLGHRVPDGFHGNWVGAP